MAAPALEFDGEKVSARFLPNRGTNGGFSLVIDGATQSHVNLEDPEDLQLEYARIVRGVIDGCRERGADIRVLHLGAGALTLPRYVGATRPGAVQHVVELHRDLFEFVLGVLPLDPDVELTAEFDDARAAVDRAARTAGGYDIAIVDVFSGAVAPRHLTTLEFFRSLHGLLHPDGVIIVNALVSTDGVGLSREMTATLSQVLPEVAVIAAPPVLDGSSRGNVVIAASRAALPVDRMVRLADTGPRPVVALSGATLAGFVGDAPVRRDVDVA